MRCDVSRTTGVSPEALVFQRDMFLDLTLISDLALIQEKKTSVDQRESKKKKSQATRMALPCEQRCLDQDC